MILQALCQLYERRAASETPRDRPAPIGFEDREIPFVLELEEDGALIQISDKRRIEGKKKIGKTELVPKAPKKSVNIEAALLWGTPDYVLGLVTQDGQGKKKSAIRVEKSRIAFIDRILALGDDAQSDPGVKAVLKFLATPNLASDARFAKVDELSYSATILAFQLRGDGGLVCQRPKVRAAWLREIEPTDGDMTCLVTGNLGVTARLHPRVRGVRSPSPTTPTDIVSFNNQAFCSYGKEQGTNAPVSEVAAEMYATALSDLLARDSRQRIQVGDASTVFWAEQHSDLEDDFALLFGEPRKDDPEHGTDRVKALYESVRAGKYLSDTNGKARFYVLGLAPNAARIAVRFWHVDTVAGISGKIAVHFDDLDIAHAAHEPDVLSLFRLLAACAVQGKADNIPPNLGGDVMRAVLQGWAYPQTWLQAAVRRNRAEQSVSYPRASVIKACLNRLIRSRPTGEKELTVSLDETNSNAAYRLGRLFSTLEKIQEEANPGLNATIRERYYGAASSSPVAVFTTLMRLKNHHLAKLENRGRAMNFERLIGEIMSGLNDFPAQLPIAEQGRFAIGYYHQRQAFYTKTVKTIESEGETK